MESPVDVPLSCRFADELLCAVCVCRSCYRIEPPVAVRRKFEHERGKALQTVRYSLCPFDKKEFHHPTLPLIVVAVQRVTYA